MFNPAHSHAAHVGLWRHTGLIVKTDGIAGLWMGLGPAVARQTVSGGIAIGFYHVRPISYTLIQSSLIQSTLIFYYHSIYSSSEYCLV